MNTQAAQIGRRELLQLGTAGAVALGLSGFARNTRAQAPAATPAPAPLFKISLAQWSFHRALKADQMDPLDFAKRARTAFDIDAIEYVNQFYTGKIKDPAYVKEMKKRADGEGVQSVLIMCDGEGALGDPDEKRRLQAVENHHKWADAAAALGCHSIRVNAESSGSSEEQQKLAADGLRRLCEYGDKLGLYVLVENHGGLSSQADWLAGVVQLTSHPRAGTLPDFGNFYDYDRYKGVAELMPWAKGVSAKSHAFDERGDETKIDYRRMLKIVVEAGYRGYLGLEYEGDKHSEAEGVKLTKALLVRVRDELAAAAAPASKAGSKAK